MTPLLVTLAAILAASPQDDQLAVEVIWTTSGDPDIAQFGAIADAAQVGDEVWVVDPMAGEIVALDLAGRVTRIVARRGEGPGELRSPGGITVTRSGGAAVHDLARQSLEIFDDRGRPTRRVRLGHAIVNPKGFVELPSGEFVIAGGIPNNCCSIHWFNAEGERQHSLLRVPQTSSQRAGVYLAGGPLALTSTGEVLFSSAASHGVYHISKTGSLDRLVHDADAYPPTGDDFIQTDGQRTMFRWDFPRSSGVFPLHEGHILNVITLAEDDRSIWQLYDASGQLVAETEVPVGYHALEQTRSGQILARRQLPETGEVHIALLAIHLSVPTP